MNDIEIIEATIEWNDTHDIENVLFATKDTENTPLDEQIFYTGVTRARKLCVVAGRRDVVNSMMSNIRQNLRYSGLCALLQAGQPSEQLSTEEESP